MSTKIYYGFKVPLSKLGLAVEWFHISMWQRVIQSFSPPRMVELPKKLDEIRNLRENYSECGFHVWIDTQEQEALISLFGLPCYTERKREGFKPWRFPKWIEEFSYWDNVDPPHGMGSGEGYKKWVQRGVQWGRVATDGHKWEERMTLVVLPKDGMADIQLACELLPGYRESWKVKEKDLLSCRKLPT